MEGKQDRGHRIRTGIAGEFLVAGELSKRGWIATLTAKNTPDVDVLAARPVGDVHARIQVKTRSPAYPYAWRVRQLKFVGERDFLILVDLGKDDQTPQYWILPTLEAVDLIKSYDPIRTSEIDEYFQQWDLLDA